MDSRAIFRMDMCFCTGMKMLGPAKFLGRGACPFGLPRILTLARLVVVGDIPHGSKELSSMSRMAGPHSGWT